MQPRILIGIDNWHLATALKCVEGKVGEPAAVKTRLGWVVYGPFERPNCGIELTASVNHRQFKEQDENLHQLVEQYFAIEALGNKTASDLLSTDDTIATKLLDSTTVRKGERFETGLLWKYDRINLPNSLPMAERRFDCLEKRMARDPNLTANLRKMMKQYVEKGYARP